MDSIKKEIIKRSNKLWEKDDQLFVAAEELAELIKAISKVRRGQSVDTVIEEMADVYIMLDSLKDQFGIENEKIDKMVSWKIQRLEEKIDKTIIDREHVDSELQWSLTHVEAMKEDGEIAVIDLNTVTAISIAFPNSIDNSVLTLNVTMDADGLRTTKVGVTGDSIFRVLAKLERKNYDVMPIIEGLYFDAPKPIFEEIRADYNFNSLYRKYELPERGKYFPDGLK